MSDAARLLDALKDAPCIDCGLPFPAEAMDFDHVGPKRANVSALRGGSVDRLLDELRHCEGPVCATCHRLRTLMRRLDAHVELALAADVDAELASRP